MEPLSKHLRKLLREAAAEAHRRALDRELQTLHAAFDQWRCGELSGFDLSDRIHQFHQGPNRELYILYGGDPQFAIAGAVRDGIVRIEELHPKVQATIERLLKLP